MGAAVEKAKAKVTKTREEMTQAISQVVPVFERVLEEALNKMVELTVIEQSDHTRSVDPADLGLLKANIAFAAESAKDAVRPAFERLNFDKLAEKASLNTSGTSYIQAGAILSPLLGPTGEFLKGAGYDVRRITGSSFNESPRISELRVSFDADVAAHGFDKYIDAYGKALIELRKAEDDEGRDAARSAWDNV